MGADADRLRANLEAVRERMSRACARAGRSADSVRLVAVTKTHPAETVQALIDLGLRDIGENRVQEIAGKAPLLKGPFDLHMLGHLQTNKVAPLLPLVSWIQSIDRERVVSRIEFCCKPGQKIKALVEVNTSGEASKSGCAAADVRTLCERVAQSAALEFRGLMTLGPLGAPEKQVRGSFALLRRLGDSVRDLAPQTELSMGMSGDFEWAIEEGATMVRIGTALFGERKYG